MRVGLATLALAIWLGLSPSAGQAGQDGPITVSVVPFASADAGQDAWLGKAIADLLSRKLAEAPSFVVLDRERLRSFLDEMELQASGFFGEAEADRLGRVAKVEQVVYGNFRIQRESLTINLLLVDLATQRGVMSAQVEGSLDGLHGLIAELALQVLTLEGVSPSQDLGQRIRFSPTDSLPATEHFYKAFDHLDHGRLEEAFGAFYAAARQDTEFLEAKLWTGRTLQSLGQDDLAIAAYGELAKHPGRRVENLDALFFKAGLLEDRDPEAAIAGYRELTSQRPPAPHALEAAFRLGMVLQRQGDGAGAYEAFALIDTFRAQIESRLKKKPGGARTSTPASMVDTLLKQARQNFGETSSAQTTSPASPLAASRSGLRRSRFFDWDHALGLYREAILKMAQLLPERPLETGQVEASAAPRGVFLLTPENTTIVEESYRDRPSLFHEQDHGPNWREKFYVIALPKGYLATGVEMEVSGRVYKNSPSISYAMRVLPFPWPANYHNSWLGSIYGQTETATRLRKEVNFHGQAQGAIALQFIENHSEIRGWRLKVKLRRVDELEAATGSQNDVTGGLGAGAFWEGEKVGHVPTRPGAAVSPALPLFKYLQHPRRSLALANSYLGGLHLVTVSGALGGRPTDLLWSHSSDAVSWSPPERLPINSASEDYDPRLLRSEDGNLRLFWLSDRRGSGWELWTSLKSQDGSPWQAPARVPLDGGGAAALAPPGASPYALPEYAVMQDRRGRWLIAYSKAKSKDIELLVSEDAQGWRSLGEVTAPAVLQSFALVEDRAGRYLLGGTTGDGRFRLWRSSDFSQWQGVRLEGARDPDGSFSPLSYPSYLFAEASGELLLLASDHIFGLRYTRIDPERGTLQLDLVKDAGLEAYAATALEDGSYLVALARGDGIDLRRYRRFQSPDNGDNPPAGRIYTEVEVDHSGNRWHRTFARHRIIEPDVTAIAVEQDGRIWWGIESGVMSVNKGDFFFRDVAGGFFTHALADIEPCGDNVYFAALRGARNRLAVARASRSVTGAQGRRTDYAVEVIALPGVEGDVTALSCLAGDGAGEGSLVVGTSSGELLALRRHELLWQHRIADDAAVTAVVAAAAGADVYAGTSQGDLYRLTGDQARQVELPAGPAPITAMTIDLKGRLWIAREGQGLWRRDANGWVQIAAETAEFPYRSIASLHADPRRGVWVTPSPEVTSIGLAHVTDEAFQLFNPPSRRLARPIDIDVAANGDLWIATALHGFYRLERSRR